MGELDRASMLPRALPKRDRDLIRESGIPQIAAVMLLNEFGFSADTISDIAAAVAELRNRMDDRNISYRLVGLFLRRFPEVDAADLEFVEQIWELHQHRVVGRPNDRFGRIRHQWRGWTRH